MATHYDRFGRVISPVLILPADLEADVAEIVRRSYDRLMAPLVLPDPVTWTLAPAPATSGRRSRRSNRRR